MLKIDTAYINRLNSNAYIFNKINTMMAQKGMKQNIISFVDAHKQIKWTRAIHIMSNENTSTHKEYIENNKLRK